jgi:hypothetical protein
MNCIDIIDEHTGILGLILISISRLIGAVAAIHHNLA